MITTTQPLGESSRHCLLAGLMFVGSTFGVLADDLSRTFLKMPYLQAPSATAMTILWESPTNKTGLVHYGLNGGLDQTLLRQIPSPLPAITNYSVTNITADAKTNITKVSLTNVVFLYEMTLTNLHPNSVYSYSAETDGVRTPVRRFKTFGAHPEKVTFIAYGDSRSNPKTHAALAANFKQYAPDFIVHMGDLVAEGKRYDLWSKEFFGPLANVIDEVPILPAIGNHEEDGTNYLRYMHLPGYERWYSYDVGPVHVLSLDFHYEKQTDRQFEFARRDLMHSRAPWKIVTLHYPVFNIGGHGTSWGHTNYLPLFHQAKVDLVIGGHSHIYERFRPIASRKEAGAWPILYITTGGGGAPLSTTYAHPALAMYAATNHFVLIEATPTTLRGSAITTNNVVLDAFELRKDRGRPPETYYAQVYPEEALKLSYAAAAELAGTAAAVPATNAAAELTFTLRSLKANPQPLEMELSLTPASALYYELEGGPLRILTPSITESNKIVSARVRATGKKKVTAEGKEKELSPALTFQAHMLAATVETVAYGPNCKVKQPEADATKKAADAKTAK